ncbi:MAG: hypothetical protein VYC17_01465 [Nitrospinota bacterium]|nr:hypothetical protein [Nitrospinota bacterium]
MKVLRTIETFLPYVCGPAQQAFQLSNRLERRGIQSPVLTTFCDVDTALPAEQMIDHTRVFRVRNQIQLMRYCVSAGMVKHLDEFDVLHAHNYRNFQTDCGFFLPL